MGLRQIILREPVSQLELRELLTLKPNDTVKAAVKLMRTKRLGCVMIVDDQGKPLGEFTEHSLLKLLLDNPEAMSCELKDVMDDDWVTVKLADPISKVLDAMHDGLRFVIVVDEDVNTRDWQVVIWAMSTRVDPVRDFTMVENTPIDYLDFASPVSGLGSKVGIDATNKLPGETDREWGEPIQMSDSVKQRVDELWPKLGL